MTFEEWKQRPVYVTQCKTAALAAELGIVGYRFRSLPGYRTAVIQRERNAIADTMRAIRNEKF